MAVQQTSRSACGEVGMAKERLTRLLRRPGWRSRARDGENVSSSISHLRDEYDRTAMCRRHVEVPTH